MCGCFYHTMSKIFVYGKEESIFEYISTSESERENCTFLTSAPSSHSFSPGDILILISEDLSLIKKTASSLSPEIPLIVVTRRYEWFERFQLLYLKVFPPPVSSLIVHTALNEARNAIRLYTELEKHIVGVSRDACTLRSNIVLSSSMASPVNISGETGTGKTLAARMIHMLGSRRSRKMVYVNCANLSSSVADSELFGHAKGAYTGALTHRDGLIKSADDSTLFLDEIGNLPLEQQAKLLDTIENGRYRRIGENSEYTSSFRLITAAQESLESLLEKKKLREDFYYRIRSFSFEIKPLRNHKEDIPFFVRFYEKKKPDLKRRIENYSPLLECDWRGNVRELFHYLDLVYRI